jgi:hypothetical protein
LRGGKTPVDKDFTGTGEKNKNLPPERQASGIPTAGINSSRDQVFSKVVDKQVCERERKTSQDVVKRLFNSYQQSLLQQAPKTGWRWRSTSDELTPEE